MVKEKKDKADKELGKKRKAKQGKKEKKESKTTKKPRQPASKDCAYTRRLLTLDTLPIRFDQQSGVRVGECSLLCYLLLCFIPLLISPELTYGNVGCTPSVHTKPSKFASISLRKLLHV